MFVRLISVSGDLKIQYSDILANLAPDHPVVPLMVKPGLWCENNEYIQELVKLMKTCDQLHKIMLGNSS